MLLCEIAIGCITLTKRFANLDIPACLSQATFPDEPMNRLHTPALLIIVKSGASVGPALHDANICQADAMGLAVILRCSQNAVATPAACV